MYLKSLQSRHTRLRFVAWWPGAPHRHRGHTHVSMATSGRQFADTVAGAAGLLLGSIFLSPARADVCADPSPIPGGFPLLAISITGSSRGFPCLAPSIRIRRTRRPSPTSMDILVLPTS